MRRYLHRSDLGPEKEWAVIEWLASRGAGDFTVALMGMEGSSLPTLDHIEAALRPHELGGGAVMLVGRMNLGLEQQALRVDHQMALAAVDLLAAVVAAWTTGLRGLDRGSSWVSGCWIWC